MAIQFDGAGQVSFPTGLVVPANTPFTLRFPAFEWTLIGSTATILGNNSSFSQLAIADSKVIIAGFAGAGGRVLLSVPDVQEGDFITDLVVTRDVNNLVTVSAMGLSQQGTVGNSIDWFRLGQRDPTSSGSNFSGLMFGTLEWEGTGIASASFDLTATSGTELIDVLGNYASGPLTGFTTGGFVLNPGDVNLPPLVNAGATQTVNINDVVQLQATASDPENDTLTYAWTQIGGTSVTLSNTTIANPTFTAPSSNIGHVLEFEVTVSDGTNVSTASTVVNVEVTITAPANSFTRRVFIPTGFNSFTNADDDVLEGFIPKENSIWRLLDNVLSTAGSAPPIPFRCIFREMGFSDFSFWYTMTQNFATGRGGLALRGLNEDNFLTIYVGNEFIDLRHFNGTSYVTLDSQAGTHAVVPFGVNNVFVVAFASLIRVYVDGVLQAEFTTSINQSSTLVGFNNQIDSAPRYTNITYSNDASLIAFSIAVESIKPIINVQDPIALVLAGQSFTQTSTASDNQDGDLSQYIEMYDTSGNRIYNIDTTSSAIIDVLLQVRDNNFNLGIASQRIIVDDGLAQINRGNRMSQPTQKINLRKSRIELSLPNDTGLNSYLVQAHKNDDVAQALVNQIVEFNNGEAIIEVGESVGFPYIGSVVDGEYPQDRGIAIVGATTGSITCFANELVIGGSLLPPRGVIAIDGNPVVNEQLVYEMESGAIFTYDNGYVVYSPNGAFDYLQPNQSVDETISYLLAGNVTQTITITVLASESVGANINTTDTQTSVIAAYEEGATYEVAFNVTGRTVGFIQPQAIGTTTAIPSYTFAKNGREVWHIKAPASCTTINLVTGGGFNGSISGLHVREVLKPITVIAPRKLEVFKVNQRQQPADSVVEGTCVVSPILSPLINPSEVVTDWVEDRAGVFLGAVNGRVAFRQSVVGNHRFVDCVSVEKKEALSLRESGDIAYVDNLWAEGGFPETETGRWNFELGINLGQSSGPGYPNSYVLNTYIDLKRDSINGQYSPPNNTDCLNMPRDANLDQARIANHVFNTALYNGGDGNIDGKPTIIVNYMETGQTFRNFRAHAKSVQILANVKHVPYASSFTGLNRAVWAGYISNRIIIWNWEVDGERITDFAQIDANTDKFEYSGPVGTKQFVFQVMKTQPAIPESIRSAFDEIEGQYKLSSSSTWVDLPKFGVDHCGDLRWRPDLPSGVYDFRTRTLLRTQQSAWVENLGVTI